MATDKKKNELGCEIKISKTPLRVMRVVLSGAIAEHALPKLQAIHESVEKENPSELILNLSQVNFLNSIGIQQWTQFLKRLDATLPVEFEDCSYQVTMHIGIIPALRGKARIKSFRAPYVCMSCSKEKELTICTAEIPRNTVPYPPQCNCGQTMELKESEDDYFSFLQQ